MVVTLKKKVFLSYETPRSEGQKLKKKPINRAARLFGTSEQSYEIKSPPWTILWFRILGIFSVENIARLGAFMFQTSDNSQYSSQ